MDDREHPSDASAALDEAPYEAPMLVALGQVSTDTLQTGIPGG
ncbi:lasso RiPP family leader peptide-containing protein [Patulibacter sp. SYSU D01012]|nr:lasso RiPP family leader peptide-containing protein [Patulibacter sp. SYSU D01012]